MNSFTYICLFFKLKYSGLKSDSVLLVDYLLNWAIIRHFKRTDDFSSTHWLHTSWLFLAVTLEPLPQNSSVGIRFLNDPHNGAELKSDFTFLIISSSSTLGVDALISLTLNACAFTGSSSCRSQK